MENRSSEKGGSVERIAAAALSIQGEIFTGVTHADALLKFEDAYPGVELDQVEFSEGFTTSTGRFVDRQEAAVIANKAGQIKDEPSDEDGPLQPWREGDSLDSFDIDMND